MAVNHATDVFIDSEGKLTEKGREAMAEYGEKLPHYHVVEFINGCLNDYDSEAYETLDDARSDLSDMVERHNEEAAWNRDNGYRSEPYQAEGTDRYTRGIYILKIEECYETDCEVE